MIRIIGRKSEQKFIDSALKLNDLMASFLISRERFVAILNGNPATSDDIVNPDDDLVLLEVFSGG
jgi:sulfur carrier protein ThiS